MKKIVSMFLVVAFVLTVLPVTAFAATLKSGSKGTEVKYLQMNLNGLGYAALTVDSQYGSKTKTAVKAFQKANGLSVDGIAGSKTLGKIDTIVKKLQKDLADLGYKPGKADGIYGSSTKSAVKKFQAAKGLKQTGVADANTLKKIADAVQAKSDENNASITTDSSNSAKSNFASTPSKVVKYSKKRDGSTKLTENFTVKEFACKDGSDEILIDAKLVALLQDIRDHFGKPVVITSAYRTASHNTSVGGVKNSQHTLGKAADIYISGVSPKQIADYAKKLGVKGVGLYSSFVHVDTRTKQSYWVG